MWAALELELGAVPPPPNSSMLKGDFSRLSRQGVIPISLGIRLGRAAPGGFDG